MHSFSHTYCISLYYLVIKCTEKNSEKLTKIHVVWSLVKPQTTAIVEIHCKFSWVALETKIKFYVLTKFYTRDSKQVNIIGWRYWYIAYGSYLTFCFIFSNLVCSWTTGFLFTIKNNTKGVDKWKPSCRVAYPATKN